VLIAGRNRGPGGNSWGRLFVNRRRKPTGDHIMKQALIAGATATALAITAIAPATAAPVLSNTAAVKSAADNSVVDVRWGWGGWLAAGVIGGIALGALASPYYSYGYSVPAYPYPYGYAGYYGYTPYTYGYAPYYGYSGYTTYAYAPRYYRARRYYRYYR
jgi:hypothetical protein